jgi:polyhydroxyalkanoate synthesis regulator phasin
MFATRKTVAPASLEQRAASAAATAAAALSVFDQLVEDLEVSATEAEQVAHEAQEEAARHTALADRNLDDAVQRRHQARAIRKLVNPTAN